MTLADLVKIVGWRLGDRDDMQDRISLELDFVQDFVLEAKPWHPWFLETEWANANTVIGERRLPYPADFLDEIEENHLYLVQENTALRELKKLDYDVAMAKYGNTDSGLAYSTPVVYAAEGLYFHLFPAPDNAYPVQMKYYAKAARISDATKNSTWLQFAGDLVVAELLRLLAEKHIKDAEAAAGFAKDAADAWNRLYAKHTAMHEVNVARSLGGNS